MILKLLSINLNFHSGIHLGNREGALEGTDIFIHSDTLYSAFFNGYNLLYGEKELEQLINRFLSGDAPFIFSSAYPFWQGKKYFPVPKNQIPRDKQSKQVSFLENSAWSRLLNGESLEALLLDSAVNFIPKKVSHSAPGEDAQPWKVMDLPRVGLDRDFSHPGDRYFHCSEVHYAHESGLFFLVKFGDDNCYKILETIWRLLADEGIGGDRTSGKGLFHYPEFKEVAIDVPETTSHSISLSLYYPGSGEFRGFNESYYDLIGRKGYVYSSHVKSLRRKSVNMFTEGSVFPWPPERFGTLTDVTPSVLQKHKVFRAGLFFGLPCASKGGES